MEAGATISQTRSGAVSGRARHWLLSLLDAPVDVQFSSGQLGIDQSMRSPYHEAFAPVRDGVALKPFDRATWQLELNDHSEQPLRVQIDTAVGDERWSVLVPVDVPPPPSN